MENKIAPLDNATLEAKVSAVVDRVERLYDIERKTGLDVSFAMRKEFMSLPKSLRVRAFQRVVSLKVSEATYEVARDVLSGK